MILLRTEVLLTFVFTMTNAKKILFLADINSVHTERWVKSVLGRGCKIALFSLSEKTTSWSDNLENFEFQCFGIGSEQMASNGRFSKFSYFSAHKEVKSFAKEVQPDIVHAHYASSYGTLARKVRHERTVLSLWGSDVYEFPKRSPLHRILFKRAVKFPKVVCSTSEDMAREAKQYVNRSIIITPFGVDTDIFVPANKEKSEILTIGTVKSLEEVYGIDRLLQLFAAFVQKSERSVRLSIFGSGSKKEELKALSKELEIEAQVDFHGRVEGDELIQAFQSLDVFVALSRRESFGVAAIEAQACGVPVLVSNVGGLPEVASPKTGRVVEEENPDAWLENLNELVESTMNPETAELTREFVVSNFSHSVCVDKLIEVYQHV